MKTTVYEQYEQDGEMITAEHLFWPVDAKEAVKNGQGRFSFAPFAAPAVKGKRGKVTFEAPPAEPEAVESGLGQTEAVKTF